MEKQWKQWETLFLAGSKITADDDCSHEIKRCLLVWRKSMTNLEKIFKRRDITLLKKFSAIKAMIFQVFVYGCDNWTIKNGEWWRIDGFELWYWTRLLRIHWTTRRSNQLMLKEIDREYLLEGPMLKLKLQYLSQPQLLRQVIKPTDVKNILIRKDPITGKDWRQEEKNTTEDEMVGWHHWHDAHEFEQAPGVGEGQGDLACCSPWGCKDSNMT